MPHRNDAETAFGIAESRAREFAERLRLMAEMAESADLDDAVREAGHGAVTAYRGAFDVDAISPVMESSRILRLSRQLVTLGHDWPLPPSREEPWVGAWIASGGPPLYYNVAVLFGGCRVPLPRMVPSATVRRAALLKIVSEVMR